MKTTSSTVDSTSELRFTFTVSPAVEKIQSDYIHHEQRTVPPGRAVIAVAILHDIATTCTMSRYGQTICSTVFYYLMSYNMYCLLIH